MPPSASARRGFATLPVFAFSRLAAALGPIALVPLVPTTTYAEIEWALATGSLLAFAADAGFSNAYPYFLLGEEEQRHLAGTAVRWHRLLLPAVLMLAGVAAVALGASMPTLMALGFAGSMSIARFSGVVAKANGRPTAASLAEALPYVPLILLLAWLYAVTSVTQPAVPLVFGAMTVYLALLSALSWAGVERTPAAGGMHKSSVGVRYAFATWPAAASLVGITLSARVVGPAFLSLEDFATFALHYRIASGLALVHQLLVTLHFRELYKASPERFQAIYRTLIGSLIALGALLALAAPPFFNFFGNSFGKVSGTLLVAVAGLVVLWISSALLEMIVYRDRLLRWQLAGAGSGFASGTIGYVVGVRGLGGYVALQAISLAFLGAAQIIAAMRRGAILSKTPLAMLCGTAIGIMLLSIRLG